MMSECFRRNNKSQAEAFGLILIVALVFVIFIIMIRIEQNRSPSDLASQYEVTELSSSTINTFLSTAANTCGRGKTFSEVARDCVRNPQSQCGSEGPSCEYFLSQMEDIFSTVFYERANLDYQVRFEAEGRTLPDQLQEDIPSQVECADGLNGETFQLPLNPGELSITLAVCRP